MCQTSWALVQACAGWRRSLPLILQEVQVLVGVAMLKMATARINVVDGVRAML